MRKTSMLASYSRVLCSGLLIAATPLSLAAWIASASGAAYTQSQEPARTQAEIEKQRQRLNSTEVEERRDAVMRLGALHRPDASRLVVPALSDQSAIVRVAAAVAVQSLPAEESTPVLTPLLNDRDPFVRQETAYALGSIGSRRAVSLLVERLNSDKDIGVRGAAAVALGMIGDEAAVVALAQWLSPSGPARKLKKQDTSFVLRAAARSLGEIKSRAGVPALIGALSNNSLAPDIRREAAAALGLIGDPAAITALRAASSEQDPYLSMMAFAAIRQIESASPKKS